MSIVQRTNLSRNPVGANVAATTGLVATRVTLAVNTGFIRATISDATASDFGQRINSPLTIPSNIIPASAGSLYTATAEGRSDVTVPSLGVQLAFFDGSIIQVGPSFSSSTTVNATSGAFTAVAAASGICPSGASFLIARVGIPGTGARSIGQIFDVRKILIEESSSGTYFDGSFADDADFTYAWTGTAELSPSVQTSKVRRVLNQGSLTQTAVRASTI